MSTEDYINHNYDDERDFPNKPTSSASQPPVIYPPVVLTRTQYSNLIGDLLLAKERISRGQLSLALETVDRMLALLRAAEKK